MNKAQELLEKLKCRREEAEAVCAYWAGVLPNLGEIPEEHLQSWLGTFDFDTIVAGLDAAVIQRSKRRAKGEPMDAEQAVLYASATMQGLRYKAMPEEERQALDERKAEISAKRSAAGKIGRAKQLAEGAKACQDFAQVCPALPEVAQPLPNTYSFTVSSSGSGSSSHSSTGTGTPTGSSESKPAAATPPVVNPSPEREEKGDTKTNTKPSGASGVTAKQRQTKIKTARGEKPKPDGFDTWTNVERTEWVACTLDCYESGWDFEHMRGCAALNGQSKPAAAGESLIGRVEEL